MSHMRYVDKSPRVAEQCDTLIFTHSLSGTKTVVMNRNHVTLMWDVNKSCSLTHDQKVESEHGIKKLKEFQNHLASVEVPQNDPSRTPKARSSPILFTFTTPGGFYNE
ncbi:hypothetical protein TNCV_4432601 [Trichonephila clavipes]|nr:hypothetical protein TNCV_4432601 [Trichonephila clavipes]